MIKLSLASLVLLSIGLSSCGDQNKSGGNEDQQKLIALHEQGREAHFKKNAKALVDQFSDNMISVNRGKVSPASKEDDAKAFQEYFDSVEFRKWDDINPPVVRFSDDHSIAYMIVDKLVVFETQAASGKQVEQTTHYAWVSIYRKQRDGNYKLECIASTNEPAVTLDL